VSGHDHGHTVGDQVTDDGQHFSDQLGIERRSRFVEEHDLGIHGQSAGNGDPLLLPAGQLRRIVMSMAAQANPFQFSHGSGIGLLLAHAPDPQQGDPDVVHGGEVVKEVEVLKDHSHLLAVGIELALAMVIDPVSLQPDFASFGSDEKIDALEEGALAGTRRPDEDLEFSPGDGQRNPLKHLSLTECFLDIFNSQDGLFRHDRVLSVISDGHNRESGPFAPACARL